MPEYKNQCNIRIESMGSTLSYLKKIEVDYTPPLNLSTVHKLPPILLNHHLNVHEHRETTSVVPLYNVPVPSIKHRQVLLSVELWERNIIPLDTAIVPADVQRSLIWHQQDLTIKRIIWFAILDSMHKYTNIDSWLAKEKDNYSLAFVASNGTVFDYTPANGVMETDVRWTTGTVSEIVSVLGTGMKDMVPMQRPGVPVMIDLPARGTAGAGANAAGQRAS